MTSKDLNRMRGTEAEENPFGFGYVKYHNTVVVKWDPAEIQLNTGGWLTPTTKRRMNQASEVYRLGVHVYQEAGRFYADYRGKKYVFHNDQLTLLREREGQNHGNKQD